MVIRMRRHQSGQAVMIVVVAMGLFMLGALGLAIDTGQLYGHRQMAQAAADAAAQAAILSIYGGTYSGGNPAVNSTYTCTNGSDVHSPCAYARLNGFGQTGSPDSVVVDFPDTVTGVILSPTFTPAAAHVVITRPVNTTLLRMFGASSATSIKAAATAAITEIVVAIPIVVTHPTLQYAFSLSGGGGGSATPVQICGGPSQAIQVNSNDANAYQVSGSSTVDLSKAGTLDTLGDCHGTGSDFGVFGGPASPGSPPSWLTPLGATEHFFQPNPPMPDPYRNVSYPARPSIPGTAVDILNGVGDCADASGCTVYTPGYFPSVSAPNGIGVQGKTAIFNPGLYYIDTAPSSGTFKGVGFGSGANGNIQMCVTTCVADLTTSGCCAGGGIMVYLTAAGGVVDIGANATVNLVGSDRSSSYKGLLFFGNRSAPTHSGVGSAKSHHLGGGGAMTLQGTIYFTNTNMTSTDYQTLQFSGHAGSSTLIIGEIVVSQLQLGGGGSILMHLDPDSVLTLPQVALVN